MMQSNLRLLQNTRNYRKTPKGVLTNIYQHQKARCKKYGYELGYTLLELHSKYITDRKYLRLHKQWEESNYHYYKKPSIDRINPNKGYTFDNIQMVTWAENRKKGDMEVAIKKYKPIVMYDLNGNKIKKFKSIKEATINMELNQGLISAVLAGKRNHTGGYKFFYENPDLLNA